MIVKPADADRYLARLPATIIAVLLYGPDQGLVNERSERLMRSVVPDIRDPFRVSEIEGASLMEDRARLADEGAALSLSGGRRVVRVRSAGNGLAESFEAYLQQPGDALVVVEAGELARNAKLRQTFAEADNAAALACYPDTQEAVAQLLERTLREQGIKIAADTMMEALPLLGGDRGTIRRQMEKLILYAGESRVIAASDVRAVLGDESEARIEAVCDAAAEGDPQALDCALERVWGTGISPVAVVRIALGHFQRLALTSAGVSAGDGVEAAIGRLRPVVHFARMASFRNQLRNWNSEKLGEALDRLLEAEVLSKSTAVPAEAACGQALLNIAGLARLPG